MMVSITMSQPRASVEPSDPCLDLHSLVLFTEEFLKWPYRTEIPEERTSYIGGPSLLAREESPNHQTSGPVTGP